jgi:hypothetical protein
VIGGAIRLGVAATRESGANVSLMTGTQTASGWQRLPRRQGQPLAFVVPAGVAQSVRAAES